MNISPQAHRNRGFTLIELLVVIAIIAILAAMLLPSLARAKSRALAANDINNCRQTMLGMYMYVQDNGDVPPAPGWGTADDCWAASKGIGPVGPVTSPAAYQTDYDLQIRYFTGVGLNPPAPSQLYQYLKNPKLLLCPEDNRMDLLVKRQIFITSYAWNGAIVGFPGNPPANPPGRPFKFNRFQASNILQWENNESGPGGGNWNDFSSHPLEDHNGAGGPGTTEQDIAFSTRHKAIQVGRMDGSAARIPYKEMLGLALNRTSKNDLWYNPLKANGQP
jgi:prepilin-type N-terminal cleavage/methylation domain-containing protein